MDIDVVILSKTSTEKLFDILRETVTSLHNSETDFKFNVIIVESNKKIKEMFGNRLYEIKAKFVIVISGNSPLINSETGCTKPPIVVPQVSKNSISIPNCFFTVFDTSIKKLLKESNLFMTFSDALSNKIFLCWDSVIIIFITNKYYRIFIFVWKR